MVDEEDLKDGIQTKFAEFAAEYPQSALAMLTGMFVGLLEFLAVENGCDQNKEIVITGISGRDITVHAAAHVMLNDGAIEDSRRQVELDAKRFVWFVEHVIEYKPAGYDGCEFGRFDVFWRSDIEGIREAIDEAMNA